jgi:hypothetical protein
MTAAKVAARFLSPMDWQEVGRRHRITFEWPGDAAPPPVQVFAKEPFVRWMQAGSTGTPPLPVATLVSVRDPAGPCRADATSDLPVGEHILGLREPGAAGFALLSGVKIADTARHWAEFLPQMLAARAALGRRRGPLPRGTPAAPFFSITTTVYDTEPRFLDELFACLLAQEYGDFEWLLLDNGSKRADVAQRLRDFAARDARVRWFRVEDNIHIIPGNRYLLQHARGRYLVPVDSDDLVYADALALFAERLGGDAPPEILFSEECKVTQDGRAADYVWRPAFSRLFALATCPAAHLMAFARPLLQQVGAYADDYAQGSHDWDTCMRLVATGARAERVPHVLYGWRMHPGSSAQSAAAKDYLRSSQTGVLTHALERLGLAGRFDVQETELGGLGFYHLARRAMQPQRLAVDFVLRGAGGRELTDLGHNLARLDYPDLRIRVLLAAPAAADAELAAVAACVRKARPGVAIDVLAVPPDALGAAASHVDDDVFAKAIVDGGMRLQRGDWLWDALGTFELDPAVGVVGGRILDEHGQVQHVGYFAGLDGFVATPNHGAPPPSVYGQLAYIRRGVTAVHGGLLVVRRTAFAAAGPLLDVDGDDGLHGIEFCLRAAGSGILTAYTPRLDARRTRPLPRLPGAGHPMRSLLLVQYPQLRAADPFHSGLLGDTSATFGIRVWNENAPPGDTSVLLGKLVRGAAAMVWATRDTARHLVRRTLGMVRNRPVRTRTGFQVPAPPAAGATDTANAPGAAPALAPTGAYVPPTGLLPMADPLHLVVDPALRTPTLNVLLPGIAMASMSGGPNTIFNLCYRMAARGVPVRFVSTGVTLDADMEPVWRHVQSLSGIAERLPNVAFVDAFDRRRPVPIGAGDVFMATAWWTAQMVKYALPLVRSRRFLYVIQDFEAVLHEHSTAHALALETYGLDYIPFVNHPFLLDYLRGHGVGRFADPEFAAAATRIDPAIDRTRFHPPAERERAPGPRRLLFYARPRSAKRNLFELGVAALQRAVHRGAFARQAWEFLAIGDPVAPVELGQGHVLRPAPWRDFDGYAAQMRSADVLLSLMLSPHPSYPPLEMAACGGLVVTNSYANKTQAAFAAISPNIMAPPATIEGIGDALAAAAARVGDTAGRRGGADLPYPADWAAALAPILPQAIAAFEACRGPA